ncbi:hypothetical protein J8990_29160, partial [Klebsiella quasipneumoniae subsp. quasipneumoniae]
MASLDDKSLFEDIFRLENDTPAEAIGPEGDISYANIQAQQLANRTRWLRTQLVSISDFREYTFFKTAEDPDGTIAGRANTPNNKLFRVSQGDGDELAFKYYLNMDGVAIPDTTLIGIGSIKNTIREFPSLVAAQADADAGNIPDGSTAFYRSSGDISLAVEVINDGGVLQPTGRTSPSQEAINQTRAQIMGLLNSTFRTSGLPEGWDVLLGVNKLGQYAGGIDSTGALNFGKMISVLSEIATANIQNLNAVNIITTGGAKITGVAPDGFDFAFFNKLMQVGVGIKNDGSLAAGKIQAFYADIG